MDITVAEILKIKDLENAKVVAGNKGLKTNVTSVTVGEVPDIARWLKGGELILSTLYAVGEETKDQLAFVEKIIKAGASALFVKPKRFIGSLDPKILNLAESNDFALIEVPPEIRWTEIVGQIYHKIIGQHLAFQKRSFDIQNRLLKEVIKGGGYQSIAKTANSLIGKPILIESYDNQTLAKASLEKELIDLLPEFCECNQKEELEHGYRVIIDKNRHYRAKVSMPVVVEQNTLGFVSAFETEEPLNDLDLIALAHAATITAVEMGNERIKIETEMRLKGDFIDDLIAKQFQSTKELLKRASFLGTDLKNGAVVLIIDINNFDERIKKNNYAEDDIQRTRREFFNTTNWIVDLEQKNSLVSLKSDSVIVFLTPDSDSKSENIEKDAQKLAESLQKGLKERFSKFTFSFGLSTYLAPDKIEKAFNEARIALDISKRLGEKEKITSFNNVGTFKLLATMLDNNSEELESFFEETVKPLVNYDKKHSSELIKTLEAFFKFDENINEVAKTMFAHRHTVRYRLERINKLTGLDVHKSDDKERLALGLKMSRLLK